MGLRNSRTAAGLAVFVAGVGFGWAQPVIAQGAAASDAPGDEGEIVVTAQRRSERLRDVPLTVTTQTGADLARAGVTNTRDLSLVVPGLSFQSQGNFAQPNIRGISTTNTGPGADSPVAIYLDGIYLPSQSGAIFDLPDISRMEVLKGPQGTLFGRNATGGAIQIFTQDPSFTATGHVKASMGAFAGGDVRTAESYRVEGYVSAPLVADRLAIGLSSFVGGHGGYLTNDATGRKFGKADSQLVRGKLLWEPGSNVRIIATAYYSHNSDDTAQASQPYNRETAGAFYADAIVPTKPWHIAFDTPIYNRSDIWGASLKGEFPFDIGTLTSLTGYTHVAQNFGVDGDATASAQCLAAFACAYYQVSNPQKTFSQELNFASRKFGSVSFVAGLFAYRDRAGQGVNANFGGFVADNRLNTDAYAAFAEVNLALTDRLTLIGGARYSYEKKRALVSLYGSSFATTLEKGFNSFTPRASLRYALSDKANVYFTYSEGFKSGAASTSFIGLPPAEPEKIKSYEGGFKFGSGATYFNAALFYYDYSDLQVQFFAGGSGAILRNAASASIIGLDVDGSMKLTSDFTLRGGISWLPRARYDNYPSAIVYEPPVTAAGLTRDSNFDGSGRRLIKTPEVTASVTADYSHQFDGGKLDAAATIYYSSAINYEVTGRVRNDAYALLNANASYRLSGSGVSFGVYGRNLTNHVYFTSSLLSATASFIQFAQPREMGVTLGYAF